MQCGVVCCSCEPSDPVTLSKYIYLIVKKDKPEDKIKKTCLQDLDVFFHESQWILLFYLQEVASWDPLTLDIEWPWSYHNLKQL